MKPFACLLLCLTGWSLIVRGATDSTSGEPPGRMPPVINASRPGTRVEPGLPNSIRPVAVDWVETVNGEAVEENPVTDGPDGPADALRFWIHRRDSLEHDLQVFHQMEGEAWPGEDYPAPAGLVNVPAGSDWADVVIQPWEDGLEEGDESVVLALAPSPAMGPLEPYRIDLQHGRARAVIRDSKVTVPSIRIARPQSESRFAAGQDVEIAATAVHPEAGIHALQFLADGRVIGGVECCCDDCLCTGPIPGQPFTGRFVWRGASAGTHVLTARTPLAPDRILESAPKTIHIVEASAARLEIVSPPDGALLMSGVPVVIETVGQDPAGLVSQVEFFANGRKIGESCFLCVAFGDFPPGTPLRNRIEWIPEGPGDYELIANGQFGPNPRITSRPARVTVQRETAPGRLTIVRPRDGEPVAAGVPIPVTAVGIGRFGGITDVQLLVDGLPVGESRMVFIRPPRVDEQVWHEFEVTLDPGPHVLVVQDLVHPALVSDPVLVVAGGLGEELAWITPPEGAAYGLGRPIVLEVATRDPDGHLLLVEFFANGRKLGEFPYECPQYEPRPGGLIPHQFVWLDAPAGRQVLIARVVRADGAVVESPARSITVERDDAPTLEVVRQLPGAYEAGEPFAVRLVVTPGPGVAAYVVEEIPPFALPAPGIPGLDSPFWRVVSVSHDGVLDPLTGKVKFGPYLDRRTRTLSYQLVPNMTVDVAHFGGVGAADGIAVPIGGDQELRGPIRHPADREPGDNSLSASELTAYAAAWRLEQPWSAGPNPIPVDYVTRAAALWRGGERYVYDPRAGPPPFCWSSGAELAPLECQTVSLPLVGGLALRTEESLPDGSLRVTVRVMPAPGVRAFAVEEHSGSEVGVIGVTQDGVPSPGGALRWGPFFGASPVELAYLIAPGSSVGIRRGVASFDGQNVPIHQGQAPPDPAGPGRVRLDPLHDGSHLITLESPTAPPDEFELEASNDLLHWIPVGRFSATGAAGLIRHAGLGDAGVRFYRAVPR
ncbi:MAG: hypothetical protein KF791_00725 [Verrucomicrobiae bacterium]|nr:hypothetical protein [Verrucomicrobiae bacterium]